MLALPALCLCVLGWLLTDVSHAVGSFVQYSGRLEEMLPKARSACHTQQLRQPCRTLVQRARCGGIRRGACQCSIQLSKGKCQSLCGRSRSRSAASSPLAVRAVACRCCCTVCLDGTPQRRSGTQRCLLQWR